MASVFQEKKIKTWEELNGLFGRGFAQLLISGEQGRGKTVLSYNIVLSSVEGSPLAMIEKRGIDTATAYVLLSIAKTPEELLKIVALRYWQHGFIVDEAALFTRDSLHFASARIAAHTVRAVINSIRAFTPRLYIVAQDVAIVPAALRAPAEWVLQVEGGHIEEQRQGYKIGKIYGYVLRRYVSKHRSPQSEREYYEYAAFELPVVYIDYVRDVDMKIKRAYLEETFSHTQRKQSKATVLSVRKAFETFASLRPLGEGRYEIPFCRAREEIARRRPMIYNAWAVSAARYFYLFATTRVCELYVSPPGVAEAIRQILATHIGGLCLFGISHSNNWTRIYFTVSSLDIARRLLSEHGIPVEVLDKARITYSARKGEYYIFLTEDMAMEMAKTPGGRAALQCILSRLRSVRSSVRTKWKIILESLLGGAQ